MDYSLSTKNILELPFNKYENDFTFIVNNKQYHTNRVVADLLSPYIRQLHYIDSLNNQFIINLKQTAIDEMSDNDYFGDFLKLTSFHNSKIDQTRQKYYSVYFFILGNIDEYIKLQPYYTQTLAIDNVINHLQSINEISSLVMLNTNPSTIVYDEIVEFAAIHFEELDKKELKKLSIEIIEEIVSNRKLKLKDEDSLLNFILSLYENDHSYSVLFDYVAFSNVSEEMFENFMKKIEFELVNNGIWHSICNRLVCPKNNLNNSDTRYNSKEKINDENDDQNKTDKKDKKTENPNDSEQANNDSNSCPNPQINNLNNSDAKTDDIRDNKQAEQNNCDPNSSTKSNDTQKENSNDNKKEEQANNDCNSYQYIIPPYSVLMQDEDLNSNCCINASNNQIVNSSSAITDSKENSGIIPSYNYNINPYNVLLQSENDGSKINKDDFVDVDPCKIVNPENSNSASNVNNCFSQDGYYLNNYSTNPYAILLQDSSINNIAAMNSQENSTDQEEKKNNSEATVTQSSNVAPSQSDASAGESSQATSNAINGAQAASCAANGSQVTSTPVNDNQTANNEAVSNPENGSQVAGNAVTGTKTAAGENQNSHDEESIKEFNCEQGKEFEGIMQYLTRKTGKNIHFNKTIEITSNSVYWTNYPKNLVDYQNDNYYQSLDAGGAIVCFDFKQRKIQLESYSIQSLDRSENGIHLKNWMIEVSNDQKKWIEIDKRQNDSKLNGPSFKSVFKINKQQNDFYRYVRIRQIGPSWYNCSNHNYIGIRYIEFFGKMKE